PAVDHATAARATKMRPRRTCAARGKIAAALVTGALNQRVGVGKAPAAPGASGSSAGGDRAEEAVGLVARAGGEVERRRRAGGRAVAELQPPQPVDRDERAVA